MTTFPYGYLGMPQGMGTQLTLRQMLGKTTVARLDTEFRRRVIALILAAARDGVPLGVGTGWRVQPNPPPPGFAKPGNSNHESFPAGSNLPNAVAADMVPNVSWPWMEANVGHFRLRTFKNVNSEPWHIQPAEIPASRNWATTPWNLARAPLPPELDIDMIDVDNPFGDLPDPPPPQPEPTDPPVDPTPPPSPPPAPEPTPRTCTVNLTLPYLQIGVPDQVAVGVLQDKLNRLAGQGLAVDNNYGPRTAGAVRNWQSFFGLTVDGECGNQTWNSVYAIEAMHNFAA